MDGLLLACLSKLTDKVQVVKKKFCLIDVNLNESIHILTDVDGKQVSRQDKKP